MCTDTETCTKSKNAAREMEFESKIPRENRTVKARLRAPPRVYGGSEGLEREKTKRPSLLASQREGERLSESVEGTRNRRGLCCCGSFLYIRI